jgi:hypothetical protein
MFHNHSVETLDLSSDVIAALTFTFGYYRPLRVAIVCLPQLSYASQ